MITRNLLRNFPAILSRNLSSDSIHVALVGSGPAGFYLAGPLLREKPSCSVDFFEKLPVPYGLVRFGVAPDHPEVKNCIHQFEALVKKNVERVKFFGNVTIGVDVSLDELRNSYDAVAFAYGAETEKSLGIPGESYGNCFSARQFVGWYNGLPESSELNPLLNSETAVVIGHGNVGLDVARILLSPIDRLRETDIPDHVLEKLATSKIGRVVTVGRRGPLQVAFTIKELREMVNLPGVIPLIDWEQAECDDIHELLKRLPRPRKRLTELLWKTYQNPPGNFHPTQDKKWQLKFCRTPTALFSSEQLSNQPRVEAVQLVKNVIIGENTLDAKPVLTGDSEIISGGLVIYSIGYRSLPIDGLPFDFGCNMVKTESDGCSVEGLTGVYACGWCSRGPTGVLASTQLEAKASSKIILDDLDGVKIVTGNKKGGAQIEAGLQQKGHRWISWNDWLSIDKIERERGAGKNKPREKITDVNEFLHQLNHNVQE